MIGGGVTPAMAVGMLGGWVDGQMENLAVLRGRSWKSPNKADQ